MKLWVASLFLVTSTAFADQPTTQPLTPQPPALPREAPVTLDMRQPAFIPKFAKADTTPAGRFAERDYAHRFGIPGPIYYGYGYYAGAYYGFGGGTWGSTQIPFR